jgi:hypothetical protein
MAQARRFSPPGEKNALAVEDIRHYANLSGELTFFSTQDDLLQTRVRSIQARGIWQDRRLTETDVGTGTAHSEN